MYLIKQQQNEIHQPQLMVKNIKDFALKKGEQKVYWYEFNVVCVITGILITVYFGKRMTRQIKMRVVHIFIDRHSKMVKKPLLQHSRFVIYMLTNRSVKNIIYKKIEKKKSFYKSSFLFYWFDIHDVTIATLFIKYM